MLNWIKKRVSTTLHQLEAEPEPAARQGRIVMSGQYVSLYKYLVNRYANTVVMTFAEIEDLLGFTLPDLARLHQDWWTNAEPNTDRPSHSDSWMLASRTAKPNLLAKTVVFERAA